MMAGPGQQFDLPEGFSPPHPFAPPGPRSASSPDRAPRPPRGSKLLPARRAAPRRGPGEPGGGSPRPRPAPAAHSFGRPEGGAAIVSDLDYVALL